MVHDQRARRFSATVEGFPVVGIGASEGGLEACTALLRALPPNTGMGFVVVQLADAQHRDSLRKLLSTATTMPVSSAADRTLLRPDHVYIVPSNKDPSLERGTLRLASLTNGNKPVDNFFSSLAKERQEKAIGVILSGTASDGANGLKAIKDLGGITFAQDEDSAKYAGMPALAAASGHVDSVLPPKQIAKRILMLARKPHAAPAKAGDVSPETSKALDRILHLVSTTTNVDFRLYKPATIKRRIRERMRVRAIPDIEQYAGYLVKEPAEIHDLFESILNRGTGFFREAKTFQALRARVLPQIAADARNTKAIRIWVAGCSTGEDVYSLAMFLLEFLGNQPARPSIQIFGTDLSDTAVQTARLGLYTNSGLKGVSVERRRRFFVKRESGYQVAKWVREICVFGRHDLSKDPPFANMDLISCQDVLIHFEPAVQRRILAHFRQALTPSGFLVLGKTQAPAGYGAFFSLEDPLHKVLTRKPDSGRPFVTMSNRQREEVDAGEPADKPESFLFEEARGLLLENYAPPAFVVDSKLNIRYFQGDTSPFIRPGTGSPSFHLLKMLRPDFVVDVRLLVYQAQKSGDRARREGILVEGSVPPSPFTIEVIPLGAGTSKEAGYVVVFLRMPVESQRGAARQPQQDKGPDDHREIEFLRSELSAQKACLKLIAEEQDAVTAQLRAAHEEVASNNLELSLTNEALSYAKEELQATNEELTTQNEELQNRNVELSTLADDVSGLLTGANIPILILDNERRIRRFTPAAQRVLDLTSTDLGRTFSEVSTNLPGEDWSELMSRVTDKLQTVEQDITVRNGRWYSLRMRPYRMTDRKTAGIMMALIDVDRLKGQLHDAEGNLQATQNLYRLLADSTTDLVSLHARDGTYIYVSPSRERLLGFSTQEVLGKAPTEFCHPEDRKILSLLFERVVRTGSPRESIYRVITKAGGVLWLETVISPIKNNYGDVTSFQSSARNVTERKRVDSNLRESEFTIRTLMESASQGILAVNQEGRIVLANLKAASMFGYRKSDFIGRPFLDLIPKELRRKRQRDQVRFFQMPKRRPKDIHLNLSVLTRNGKEFPAEISLSSIQVNDEILAVAFVTDISKRKQSEAALLESHDKLVTLSNSHMAANDEASRRLSRELHDVFSQELAALATESRLLKRDLPRQATGAATRAEGLAQRIAQLAKDMHHMSRRLHPAVLDELGLQAALRAECEAFSQLHKIPAAFTSKRPIQLLNPDIALCLYRVTQESLRNIAKHSGTKTVSVELAVIKGEIQLTIEDFGRGFDSESPVRKGLGLGLISMRERVRAVGGTLAVNSRIGKGTTVLAQVPVRTAP